MEKIEANSVTKKIVKKVIAVGGKISSGKTTLAKQVSDRYDLPIASFGAFIKHYCEINNLPTDRKNLQDVGERFIIENPKRFLKDVITLYKGNSIVVILEGIRHQVIIKNLPAICDESLIIFVDTDANTIHNRYSKRVKDSDVEKEYNKIASHPVEFEIDHLKPLSDFILRSNKNQEEELFKTIDKFLGLPNRNPHLNGANATGAK